MVVTTALVVVPTHGFGNRLRMLASCYALSKSFNLPMHICWIPNDNCNIALSKIFCNPFIETKLDDIKQSNSYMYYGKVHTRSVMNRLTAFVKDPTQSKQYLVLEGGHEFSPPGRSVLQFLQEKHHFYASLRFQPYLLEAFEAEMSGFSKPYAAVHVRCVLEHDWADVQRNSLCDFEQHSSLADFKKVLSRIKPDMPVVCVSNRPRKNWSELLGRKVGTVTRASHAPGAGRNSLRGMVSSIIDFMVLAHADVIIGSYYSSFSDEASFFAMVPKITPLSTAPPAQNGGAVAYHCHNFSQLDQYYGLNLSAYAMIKNFCL